MNGQTDGPTSSIPILKVWGLENLFKYFEKTYMN